MFLVSLVWSVDIFWFKWDFEFNLHTEGHSLSWFLVSSWTKASFEEKIALHHGTWIKKNWIELKLDFFLLKGASATPCFCAYTMSKLEFA